MGPAREGTLLCMGLEEIMLTTRRSIDESHAPPSRGESGS
jgi:hypothetical protein